MLTVVSKGHSEYEGLTRVYLREGSPRVFTALGRSWRVVKDADGIRFVELAVGDLSAKYASDSFGSGSAGRATIDLKPEHADLPENDAAPQDEAVSKSRRRSKPESSAEE